MNTTTVLLAVNHALIRRGLAALLESQKAFRVVGEAGDGIEALRLAERLKPRILIVGIFLPALNGIEVVRQVARRVPETRIAVLANHPSELEAGQAFRNGASGFLLDTLGTGDMLKAVAQIAAGQRYLSPPLSVAGIEAYGRKARVLAPDPYDALTAREREVLQLVAEGRTSGEVAHRLFISPRTVEIHRANMMRKLSLRTQSDLVRLAIRRGILPTGS